MKRKICLIFILSLAVIVTWSFLFANIKPNSNQLKDGSYKGTSFKFPWQMTVLVTIKNAAIAEIRVLKQFALQKYTDALKPLIERIIKNNSTEVDGVTGATISSNALKKAVNNALTKADANKSPE